MAPGPIWETTLFLPSLPSPSSSHPPRAPILPLTHLSLRAPTNKPIGLDDLAVLPGMAVPTATELLWRGVVELDQKALRWVRPEAIASLGLGAAQGARVVRVTVQGRWRMCTFDDNYSTELRAPDTDALVMHTRSNKRYQVLSMEAMCYSRSRAWLERALLVNFVILCGRRWSGENQSVPWLVNKYKELHKRPNPSLAFFTTDIYHVLAAHASYLKDYWQRARWRHAEYAKRVRIELGAWEQFWRRAEGMREKVRREGRTWGRKREVGAALGVGKKRARRKSPPGGSAKKRRVDPPAPSAAAAPTPPETARKQQQPIGLFGKPPSFGRPATSKEPAVAGRSGGSRPRGRGTVEEIDLSGEARSLPPSLPLASSLALFLDERALNSFPGRHTQTRLCWAPAVALPV
ncbi:hypothetical protein CALVIDRAFT_566484 [Calocera viscosa TUFC12733]|uniref:Uncharacterized protein n=1 Tax=Calocera viscosa (strain TUFC12733) TaxID=1330018 RepID=A0A167JDG3_CALVF|nr:hypothetical protein CALVIDRAFT_566484 [Calocera viscosa TUFC12733]